MGLEVMDRARGRWRGILISVGLPETALQNKHGPCPICGGKDRFRFDNKDGRGTWICTHCGAGDGMTLLMKFKELSFSEAAREVERTAGKAIGSREFGTSKLDAAEGKSRMDALLSSSRPIAKGDDVDRYLAARGVDEPKIYPPDLLICPSCWYAPGKSFPAMIGVVRSPSGAVVNMHRTYLSDGRKADVESPRRLMQGRIPEGSAIRLGPVNRVLGVAEGIETALAASHLFEMPVWSALNASILAKWHPPPGVEEVVVFGDNDVNDTGQSAANQLVSRISRLGMTASVQIPRKAGTDWADEALSHHLGRMQFATIAEGQA